MILGRRWPALRLVFPRICLVRDSARCIPQSGVDRVPRIWSSAIDVQCVHARSSIIAHRHLRAMISPPRDSGHSGKCVRRAANRSSVSGLGHVSSVWMCEWPHFARINCGPRGPNHITTPFSAGPQKPLRAMSVAEMMPVVPVTALPISLSLSSLRECPRRGRSPRRFAFASVVYLCLPDPCTPLEPRCD